MKKIIGNTEYEILGTIAEGGMGTVYKALEKGVSGFEKLVAIKMLLKCYSRDKRFINRFIDEAKLVANLIHENIVQIYQLSKHQDDYFFVLEYVDGTTLFDLMEFHRLSRTKLPVKLAVFIASSIARALAYAHSRYDLEGNPLNIVHCDICPHNILINTEGVVKLTDFGVARAITVKERGTVSGKLPFMSPEQINRQPLDFRSDIYSLGLVLFYMLSGGKTCRYLNVNPREIIAQARNNYIDWDLLPSELDKNLLLILKRMLSTIPEKRYRSASKTAKKLEQFNARSSFPPTSSALAKYLRKEMPALFEEKPGPGLLEVNENDGILSDSQILKTVKIKPEAIKNLVSGKQVPGDDEVETDNLAKTRMMSERELISNGIPATKSRPLDGK
jgi:serine/threonine protein kinase